MRRFGSHWRRWHSKEDDSESQDRPPFGHRFGPPEWMHKRRLLFFRFFRFLGMALLLFLIGTTGLAYIITRLVGAGGQVSVLIWLLVAGLAISFPLMIGAIIMRSFFHFANPVARVMAAADAVADGDLGVRVPVEGSGELARLARSFNRMVSELERTDQLRRNLTADVAHELRTPLHIIQGNLEGIQDGVYAPTPEQIDLLLDETQQLARLVEDLRTLSLAESGQLLLNREPVDITELLEDVQTSFSGQAAEAGITIKVDIDPGTSPLSVQGDAGRLDQVLGNLVANALQHTKRGGTICLHAGHTDGSVSITVRDNGSGIPAADLPHIFDRFWRGKGARQGSSGLGLAIARQLVEAQGGAIRVESQEGEGTTFTIELKDGG